jgi:predicted Zn-dependent peptidase
MVHNWLTREFYYAMYTTHRLRNETRLILAPQQDTPSVCVQVLFPVGSRQETARLSGASHFVEHMMFKGTERRPTTLDISRDLDRVGAEYNAFTGKEYTGYYVKASAGHVDLALDMLADMLYASTYVQEEFDRERRVIIEEIKMYEENPQLHLGDMFEQLLYRGHALGRSIAGTEKTMNGISRGALVAYRDAHYLPRAAVVTVAGNFGDDIIDRVESTFGQPNRRTKTAPRSRSFTTLPKGPKVQIQQRDVAQAQLALGVPTFGAEHPRRAALTVLANILGGTMSSRLFIAVRERRGLAYSVRASTDAYRDVGELVVTAGLDAARIDKAMKVVLRELRRLREHLVTREELERAQDNIEGRLTLAMEDACVRADWYGKQATLRSEIWTPKERIRRIRRVTREQIGRVARQLLHTNRLHLALIGPFDDVKRFEKMMKL